jgi:hypothetical protein
VALLTDFSEAMDGERGISTNGERGAFGMLYPSTELLSDRLSTSSEFPSSTDLMLGEPPNERRDDGAARFGGPLARIGRENEGVGEFCVARTASGWNLFVGSTCADSKGSGECDLGNGK